MPESDDKPAVVEAVDKLNDLIEDAALTAADAAVDPEHVAPVTNEQVYIPEATEAVAPAGVKSGPERIDGKNFDDT